MREAKLYKASRYSSGNLQKLQEGRKKKIVSRAGTKFLNTRSYRVVTKIPGQRVIVGAFRNDGLVSLTGTNFQNHIN